MLKADTLRELLRYDPDTGLFWWLVPGRKRRMSAPVGCVRPDGRRVIRIEGRLYLAHQLAWLWMTGDWVPEIDHENLDPGDNRWGNLRAASSSDNKANRRVSSRNKLGVKGVWAHQKGYRSVLQRDGQRIDLGVHPTVEQAAAAYANAASQVHGQFARSS